MWENTQGNGFEAVSLGLGLEPTWLGLKPSQNPAWDLNPCGWDSNPAETLPGTQTHMAGTQTQPKPCLGLEPTWLRLEPRGNPAWDSNPRGWDSNSAITHRTWFQDLMKLRFLMSHRRKNSVGDKVIGKEWIYSESERSTLHRQSVGHDRANAALKCDVVSFYRLGDFLC